MIIYFEPDRTDLIHLQSIRIKIWSLDSVFFSGGFTKLYFGNASENPIEEGIRPMCRLVLPKYFENGT